MGSIPSLPKRVFSTAITWLRALPRNVYVLSKSGYENIRYICVVFLSAFILHLLLPCLKRCYLYIRRYILLRNEKAVQFFCGQKNNIMANKFKAKLIERCYSEYINLELFDCETVGMLQNNTPAIVVCVNASRLGTDVSGAVEGLPDPRQTVVVVLHHKQQHALPSVASEKLLMGPEFKDLGGIIDLAYMSDAGFYTCEMNTSGFEKLVEYIKTLSSFSTKEKDEKTD